VTQYREAPRDTPADARVALNGRNNLEADRRYAAELRVDLARRRPFQSRRSGTVPVSKRD